MTLIDPRTEPSGRSGGLQEEFARLSRLFRSRLQNERVEFAALSAELAQAEEAPEGIFTDLHFRAHRLKGAAAMFELKDIAAVAHVLELAAKSAVAAGAANTDPAVWTALVALVESLAEFEDEAPPPRGIGTVQPAV